MERISIEQTKTKDVEKQPTGDYKPLREAEQKFHDELWDYFKYVEKQLQPYHWRIISLFSSLFKRMVSLFSRLFKKLKRQR